MAKTLVAYFSTSGTTEKLAKKLADIINADLHEIKPVEKYRPADLDWTNKKSRSSIEMNDRKFRPQIANKVENMEEYDKIFVGFPIWWYIAPTIINSFLEQYELNGKVVIPIATSGGSEIGDASKELQASCVGAELKVGKVFSPKVDDNELKKWAQSF